MSTIRHEKRGSVTVPADQLPIYKQGPDGWPESSRSDAGDETSAENAPQPVKSNGKHEAGRAWHRIARRDNIIAAIFAGQSPTGNEPSEDAHG